MGGLHTGDADILNLGLKMDPHSQGSKPICHPNISVNLNKLCMIQCTASTHKISPKKLHEMTWFLSITQGPQRQKRGLTVPFLLYVFDPVGGLHTACTGLSIWLIQGRKWTQ